MNTKFSPSFCNSLNDFLHHLSMPAWVNWTHRRWFHSSFNIHCKHYLFHLKLPAFRASLTVQWFKTLELPLQWPRVRSPVRELSSHMAYRSSQEWNKVARFITSHLILSHCVYLSVPCIWFICHISPTEMTLACKDINSEESRLGDMLI